jgi:beta-carotene ketolase (CrtO type)
MADAAYDAVIIGGGTKSIVTAIYLAKYGGMSVGVFEERRELCSGLTSEIGVVPGFVADYHATGVVDWYYAPVREDFPDFEEKGGKILHLPGSAAIIVEEDQSCWITYNREVDPNQELTAKGLAQFSSERDAETYMKIWELTKPGTDYYVSRLQDLFNPPPLPDAPPSSMERWFQNYLAQPDCLIDYSWLSLPALYAYQRLWERPAITNLFWRRMIIDGHFVELTSGIALFSLIAFGPETGYIEGGMHNVAHAYQRLLHENGGKWFPRAKVDKIIIENGAAKGIQLADGTQIEAKKLIVSGVSPRQLCIEMIGPDHLNPKTLRKVDTLVSNIKGLAWYSWFLHELPDYKATAVSPDINRCAGLALGTDDLRPLSEYIHWLRLGKFPPIRGRMSLSTYSAVDKTRSPEGKHVIMEDLDIPTATYLSEREWLRFKKTHAQEALEEWQKYAPNMTWDNVIGFAPQTPYDAAGRGLNFAPDGNAGVLDLYPGQLGRVAPIPEMAQYRMPGINNLYHTGSWRPRSGANCTQGYCCYKVIAEDLNLRKPWEEQGRPY